MGLDKLLNTGSLKDEVLKIVPKVSFVDIKLDLMSLVPSQGHFVFASFQVVHLQQEIVTVYVLFSHYLNLLKPVFNYNPLLASDKSNLLAVKSIWAP